MKTCYLSISNQSDDSLVKRVIREFEINDIKVNRHIPKSKWDPAIIKDSDFLLLIPNKEEKDNKAIIGKGQLSEINVAKQWEMPVGMIIRTKDLFEIGDDITITIRNIDNWVYHAFIEQGKIFTFEQYMEELS